MNENDNTYLFLFCRPACLDCRAPERDRRNYAVNAVNGPALRKNPARYCQRVETCKHAAGFANAVNGLTAAVGVIRPGQTTSNAAQTYASRGKLVQERDAGVGVGLQQRTRAVLHASPWQSAGLRKNSGGQP